MTDSIPPPKKPQIRLPTFAQMVDCRKKAIEGKPCAEKK